MATKEKNEWIRAKKDTAATELRFTAAAAPVEIEARSADDATKPRKFSMVAYTGGAMNVGMFALPVVVDLAGMQLGNSARPILIDHFSDISSVLGQTEKIEVKGNELIVEGAVFGESERAKQVIALNDKGFKFQASIGARVINREFVAEGSTAQVNGQTFNGPIHVARKTVLGEISFVILGADDNTSARIAAGAAKGTPMNFEQWLEARGFTLADLTDAQKASLEAIFSAEGAPAPKTEPAVQAKAPAGNGDLNAVLNAERQKEEKRKQIVDLTAKALQDYPGQLQIIEALSRTAMDGEWDAGRYELELLRATRPQVAHRSRSIQDDGLNAEVIEAALCLSGGMENPESAFSEKALEAASKRWRHGLGLVETLTLFARRNGHDHIGSRDVGSLLRASFSDPSGPMLRASGVSTLSLPGILSNVANKFVRRGFESVENTWRGVAARRNVRDFKQVSSYSLTGDFQYVELPPGGEIKHANIGEVAYTNQAKTYARMSGIDRRDIINDDLSALTQVPFRNGRGGALKLNDVFWAIFLNNSAFFSAGNNNAFTGVTAGPTTDSRLNIDGLTRAEVAFFNQTDPDGKPLGITPRILLVPNALNAVASQLMNSTEIRNTTDDTKYPTANPHSGKFSVVRSTYLSNASYTGNSATAWYLLADPMDMPVIEVAFLNGVETPTVETADADFNTLGIQIRGYHDFGVSLQEYRGGVRMAGA